jgi:hypothetical protein
LGMETREAMIYDECNPVFRTKPDTYS